MDLWMVSTRRWVACNAQSIQTGSVPGYRETSVQFLEVPFSKCKAETFSQRFCTAHCSNNFWILWQKLVPLFNMPVLKTKVGPAPWRNSLSSFSTSVEELDCPAQWPDLNLIRPEKCNLMNYVSGLNKITFYKIQKLLKAQGSDHIVTL